VEIFGGGNVLLLDEKDTIIQALTYRRMRDRNIIRGETYKLPPSRGISPDHATYEKLLFLRTQKGGIAKTLGRALSIGNPYVEEILLKAGVEKSLPAHDLSIEDIQSICTASMTLIEESKKSNPKSLSRNQVIGSM